MWISKKKYEDQQRKLRNDTFLEALREDSAMEQAQRISKLEKQVKKLKKIVREGY